MVGQPAVHLLVRELGQGTQLAPMLQRGSVLVLLVVSTVARAVWLAAILLNLVPLLELPMVRLVLELEPSVPAMAMVMRLLLVPEQEPRVPVPGQEQGKVEPLEQQLMLKLEMLGCTTLTEPKKEQQLDWVLAVMLQALLV